MKKTTKLGSTNSFSLFPAHIEWGEVFGHNSLLFIIAGVTLAVLALEGFMIPNHFLDGGVTGLSLLLHETLHLNLSISLLIINTLLLYPAYKRLGVNFTIRSFTAVCLLALGLQFISFPIVTHDRVLAAIFGGIVIGTGIGLVIRGGAALDGLEILAVFTIRRIGVTMSEVIMFFNCVIFLTAAFKFGIESAMFAIITYFTATRATDYVVDGIEECISLTVISGKSEDIKALLVNGFGKAVTVYKGERGYLPDATVKPVDCDIIVTIVTRLEVLNMKNEIAHIDPKAFMFVNSIKETKGGIVKQKSGH